MRLRQAQQALLILDFDGTLSPFVANPELARPYAGVAELLQQLMALEDNRLVVISGRELESLRPCLGLELTPELWGCHGWQRCLPEGRSLQRSLPESVGRLLEQAADLVQAAGFAEQLERKPVSLALHWRGLDLDKTACLRDQIGQKWRQLVAGKALQVHSFDGGLELRCSGVDKGTAVKQLLVESAEDVVAAYLGDDLTDEDAFVELADRGLKVLVRTECRATAADLWLRPPQELLWFLHQWIANRRGQPGEST